MQCFLQLSSGDEVKVEGVFLLADRTKHCETSCKRSVTLCNASKICCSIAAIVAKSRTLFYFVQRLLQQKILRDLMISGYVTQCNFSCNLCRNKIARQVARKVAYSVTQPLRKASICKGVLLTFPISLYLPPTSSNSSFSGSKAAKNGGILCLASANKCFRSSDTDSSTKHRYIVIRK